MRDTSKRFAYLVVGLVVLGLAGFVVGRPLYKKFKANRAVTMAKEAEQLMKEQRWEEAAKRMQTAVGLAQTEPEVLRLASRFAAQFGQLEGLSSWKTLLASPESTWQDRLDYISMALQFGRLDLAGPELIAIMRTNVTDPQVLQLAIRHQRLKSQPAGAVAMARQWVDRQPTDLEAQLMLGGLLAGSGDPVQRAEGLRLLMSLAVGKGKTRDEAVDLLARTPDLPLAEGQILLKALAERPGTTLSQADVELKIYPDRRDQIVPSIVERAKATTNDLDLLRYAAWLGEHNEIARVPDLLPEERVANSPLLLTARLQALIEADRMNEVVPYLQASNTRVEPHMVHCLNALVAQKQGKNYLVRTHFDSALAAAGNNPEKLRFIAAYAERIGERPAAIAAYQRLMLNPTATTAAGKKIMSLVGPLDDAYTIRDTLRKLSAFMPADENLFLASAYAGFLIGESQLEVRAELSRRAKKSPNQPLFPLVQALGELRAGNNTEALLLIEGLKYDWDKAEPRFVALYAAVLGANQQREAARLMASKVDINALKPQEAELIKPWRQL